MDETTSKNLDSNPELKNTTKFLPLLLVLFIDSMGMGILFPILAVAFMNPRSHFLAANVAHGTRLLDYAVVFSVFMFCWFFGAAILGEYSDSKGRRPCLLLCLLGATLGYALSFVALIMQSVWLLILGRIIAGFTAGSQSIAQAAIVDGSEECNLNKNMGYMILSVCLGFVAGPIIGGVFSDSALSHWFTLSTPMLIASGLSFINLVLLYFTFHELKKPTQLKKINLASAINLFLSAFKHPSIRFLCIIFLIFICGWSSYYSFMSVYLVSVFHYSALKNAMFNAFMGTGFCLGSGVLNARLSVYPPKYVAIITIIFAGAGCFLTMLTQSQELIWGYAFIIGLSISIAFPNILTLFSQQVGEDKQGWVMGVNGSMMALSFGISALLTGFVGNIWVKMPLLIAALALLISSFILYQFKSYKKIT